MKKVFLVNEFQTSWKQEVYNKLYAMIVDDKVFKNKEVLMLGNYKVGRYDFDAIIVVNREIFVVEFKKDSVKTIYVKGAMEPWTSETGEQLWAGKFQVSPYKQSLVKRNILYRELKQQLELKPDQNLFVKSIVLYPQDITVICCEDFDVHTHRWFFVKSLNSIIPLIEEHTSLYSFTNIWVSFQKKLRSIQQVPKRGLNLRIGKFFETCLSRVSSWLFF